jgi:hypothetical protein
MGNIIYTSIMHMILVYDTTSTMLLYHSLMFIYYFLESQCKYVYKIYLSLFF